MNRSEKIFTYKIYEHCVALLKKVGTIFDDWQFVTFTPMKDFFKTVP